MTSEPRCVVTGPEVQRLCCAHCAAVASVLRTDSPALVPTLPPEYGTTGSAVPWKMIIGRGFAAPQ